MKWRIFLFGALLLCPFTNPAQQPEPQRAPAQEPATGSKEREQKFQDMMTGVVLEGRWCLIEDGEMTEEREETYRILSVMKAGGDLWIIRAQIKFGDREATIPVPVQVKWAGETPVITLDENTQLPELGRYSARVVLHNDTYAGTWSGGDHKGLLHGIIKKR